jgi:hypothetical protein
VKFSIPDEARHLLKLSVASHLVADTLLDLGLNMQKQSKHRRDELLLEKFGHTAPYMLGILEWRAHYGEDFWEKLGWSKQTYNKKKKQLKAANLWDFSPDEHLPALLL